MKRSKVFLILVFIGTLLFYSCQQENPISTDITIAHWGQSKILIYLPLYVAIDAGFFEAEGLSVKLKYSGNDDQVFATVLSGDAQFGVGDPAFTVVSREQGGQGKVVATLVGGLANWGVAKEGFPKISDYKELEGYKISSFPSPSTTFTVLSEIIKTNNLQSTEIIQTPFGNEIALLESGQVDIAIMLEPNTSAAVDRGNKVVFDLAEFYGPFTLTGVTTTEDYINENSEIVDKVIQALNNALAFCHTQVDSTINIAVNNFPELKPSILDDAVHRMLQANVIPQSSIIDTLAFRKLLEIREKVGDIESVSKGLEAIYNRKKQ